METMKENIENIFSHDSVVKIEILSPERVFIYYKSRLFFRNWPHGDKVGSKDEKEEYYQNELGIDWDFIEIASSQRWNIQIAEFNRGNEQ